MGGGKKYLLLVLAVEGKKGKKDRKRERKEDPTASSSDFRCFDGRNSLGQELKSVYATRATPQEVGILPTLVISTLRVV